MSRTLTGESFWSGVEVLDRDESVEGVLAYRIVCGTLHHLTAGSDKLCDVWPAWVNRAILSRSPSSISSCLMPGVTAHHETYDIKPCLSRVCLLCRSRAVAGTYRQMRDAYLRDPYLVAAHAAVKPGNRCGHIDAKRLCAVSWVRNSLTTGIGKDNHRLAYLVHRADLGITSPSTGSDPVFSALLHAGVWPAWAVDGRKFGTLARRRSRGISTGGLPKLKGSHHAV